jgi:hypothetical protein
VRGRTSQVEASRFSQGGDQLFVDDLHHLLGRRKALLHLYAHGALTHPANEILNDFEVNVGLE